MRPVPNSATGATQDNADVTVSVHGDHLVIRPPAQLDLEMTTVLVIAAASAVAAGSVVMIDLDPDTASEDIVARRPLGTTTTKCVTGLGGPVEVLGPGFVRLATRDAHWTIDVTHGRLCRSDAAIQPHFVGPDSWTSIQALWLTQASVTALTHDGTYLSTLAAWTIGNRPMRPARVRRQYV